MNLKDNLKKICKSKNIKFKELAEKLNMDSSVFSRAINGNPTLKTIELIANVLEVPPFILLLDKADGEINIADVDYFLIKKY